MKCSNVCYFYISPSVFMHTLCGLLFHLDMQLCPHNVFKFTVYFHSDNWPHLMLFLSGPVHLRPRRHTGVSHMWRYRDQSCGFEEDTGQTQEKGRFRTFWTRPSVCRKRAFGSLIPTHTSKEKQPTHIPIMYTMYNNTDTGPSERKCRRCAVRCCPKQPHQE